MRYFSRLLVLSGLLLSSGAYAGYEVFIDPLYWRATETLDWVHTNNLSTPNLVIGYQGVSYDYDPGVRLGVGYASDWDTKLYFTKFYTRGYDSANGNLTTGFLGGRLSQTIPATLFYQTGQADFRINFNMFDWDVGKRFNVTNNVILHPIMGLEAGEINQTLKTSFQSPTISITEVVKNNFKGIGPKLGIGTDLIISQKNNLQFSIIANVETSYLWGHWNITDLEQTNSGGTVNVNVAPRNYGALSMQAMLGASVDYKTFAVKLAYEISDWFNQCQIFDDETGTQNNDLVLQGLTLSLVYKF